MEHYRQVAETYLELLKKFNAELIEQKKENTALKEQNASLNGRLFTQRVADLKRNGESIVELKSMLRVATVKHSQHVRDIIALENELIEVKRRYHRCRRLLEKNAD